MTECYCPVGTYFLKYRVKLESVPHWKHFVPTFGIVTAVHCCSDTQRVERGLGWMQLQLVLWSAQHIVTATVQPVHAERENRFRTPVSPTRVF